MATIRLSDPLTNPNAPGFTDASINFNNPGYYDRLPGGVSYFVQTAVPYLSVQLTYEDLLPAENEVIMADVLRGINGDNRFEVILPHKEQYVVSGDTSTVTITSGQLGSTLLIEAYFLNDIPRVGAMFKLTNHSTKVYRVTSVDLTGTTLTLGIYPNLVKETTGNEKPIFNNVLYTLSLENPTEYLETFSSSGLYDPITLNLVEQIEDN